MNAISKSPDTTADFAAHLDYVNSELKNLETEFTADKKISKETIQEVLKAVKSCNQSLSNKVSPQLPTEKQKTIQTSVNKFLQINQTVLPVLNMSAAEKVAGVLASSFKELTKELDKLAKQLKDKNWKIGAKVAETEKGKQS